MKKFSSTMKGSSRRASHRRHLRNIALLGAGILLALFLLPRAVTLVANVVMAPVVGIQSYFGNSTATIPSYFRDRNGLLETQRDLEKKLADQSGGDATIARLEKENELLRSTLGSDNANRIGAGVIARPSALPYDVFVIDRGSSSGVRKDAPVYIGRDQVIGFVAEVFSNTAVVALVTTPELESTVYIYGPDIYTTAVGMGAGSLRVSVPQGITLSEGDLVVVPSFNSGVYGTIDVIQSEATQPEQFGFVSTDVSLSSIRFVSVGDVPLESISFEQAKAIVDGVRADLVQVPVPSGILVDTGVSSTTVSTSTASSTVAEQSEQIETEVTTEVE